MTRLRAAGCVFAEDEARLLVTAPGHVETLVRRRVRGEPLEHVLGWVEFCGARVAVGPGVFVPRRRTEFLVDQAVAFGGSVVVDLCCGAGAIGSAIAARLPDVRLHAADVDPAALDYARRNVPPGTRVHEGDLYAALPAELRGRIDLLAANVPYVPSDEIALMPPEAREHEPRATLDGGSDGLDVLRRVSAAAAQWLAPGGRLLTETSLLQARTAAAILAGDGLDASVLRDDERGATVVTGQRPQA